MVLPVRSLDAYEKGAVGFSMEITVLYPPGITLQVILESVLNSKSDGGLGQYTTKSLLEEIRK